MLTLLGFAGLDNMSVPTVSYQDAADGAGECATWHQGKQALLVPSAMCGVCEIDTASIGFGPSAA